MDLWSCYVQPVLCAHGLQNRLGRKQGESCTGAGINDFLRYAVTGILRFPPHEFSW